MSDAGQFEAAMRYAERFFMGTAESQLAARRIAEALEALAVPYAIAGGLAVASHHHVRVTTDVDLLLTPDGLTRFKDAWLGRGWVERFPGSRGLRDTVAEVPVDVLLSGGFPGDGEPKPVCFPDPAAVSERRDGLLVVTLPTLIELKLASGLSAPHRLQDLADAIALIKANALTADFGEQLDPSVQPGYADLWQRAQATDPHQEP